MKEGADAKPSWDELIKERDELRRQLNLLIDAACRDGAGPRLRNVIEEMQHEHAR